MRFPSHGQKTRCGNPISNGYSLVYVSRWLWHRYVQRIRPVIFGIISDSHSRNGYGSAFNPVRGVQFFTPVVIAVIAETYGLGGGISLLGVIFSPYGSMDLGFSGNKGEEDIGLN